MTEKKPKLTQEEKQRLHKLAVIRSRNIVEEKGMLLTLDDMVTEIYLVGFMDAYEAHNLLKSAGK